MCVVYTIITESAAQIAAVWRAKGGAEMEYVQRLTCEGVVTADVREHT